MQVMVPPKDEETKINKITISALNVLLVMEKRDINKIVVSNTYRFKDIGMGKGCLSKKKKVRGRMGGGKHRGEKGIYSSRTNTTGQYRERCTCKCK